MTLFIVRETLRIELTDTQGHLLPKLDTAAEDAESGRGLMLVDALATRWGVSSAPYPKKTVWAEVVVGTVGGHPASAQSRV
ncbi:ATP-binding protein [Streptomyces sp. NPDC091377]|uniref:ATP-binding protein n=1 Tax=Streptomyces sp. NPDC091377 TaxID=3365995 RepID=UPI00381A8EC3